MKKRTSNPLKSAIARLARRALIVLYLIALLLSHLLTPSETPSLDARAGEARFDEFTYTDANGRAQPVRLASRVFGGWDNPAETRPPVVLLHGCPGSAADFARLAPAIAADGRRVVAIDLPGFGASKDPVDDYSMRSFAHAVVELLKGRGLRAAHLVGWSNSGGVIVNAAHDDPDTVASVTLLAAIGDQRFEGSGSYTVEHVKYTLGLAVGVWAPELVPHFGALGDRAWRRACLRFFSDSDQRPLAQMMKELQTPALILHGRDDFLVPLRAAERHHELLARSRFVVLNASHFIPFTNVVDAAKSIGAFVHDVDAGTLITHTRTDPAARGPAVGPARAVEPLRSAMVASPWWVHVLVVGAIAFFAPVPATVAACALVVGLDVDWFVALIAITVGRSLALVRFAATSRPGERAEYWRRALARGAARAGFDASARTKFGARDWRRVHTSGAPLLQREFFGAGHMIGTAMRGLVAFTTAWIWCAFLLPSNAAHASWTRAICGASVALLLTWVIPLALTRAGRARLRISLARARSFMRRRGRVRSM